eukprot:351951-Chlamydomonas_euryale.AAC.3
MRIFTDAAAGRPSRPRRRGRPREARKGASAPPHTHVLYNKKMRGGARPRPTRQHVTPESHKQRERRRTHARSRARAPRQ